MAPHPGRSSCAFLTTPSWEPTWASSSTTSIRRRVEVSATPVELGAQVGLGANELFFLSGGVSYVSLDADRALRIDEEVGWYLALGYRSCQDEGGLGFFAEVLYRGIEATAEGTIDDIQFFDIEGRLDGWAINVGVTWR